VEQVAVAVVTVQALILVQEAMALVVQAVLVAFTYTQNKRKDYKWISNMELLMSWVY
jgi:hypothetical protein